MVYLPFVRLHSSALWQSGGNLALTVFIVILNKKITVLLGFGQAKPLQAQRLVILSFEHNEQRAFQEKTPRTDLHKQSKELGWSQNSYN